MVQQPLLLSIVELGGYPDFSSLYRTAGYRFEQAQSGRKVLTLLKKLKPAVVVTEFNYQHEFRDRTSQLESQLAVVQSIGGARVVVFYYPEEQPQLDALIARYPFIEPLRRPIDEVRLAALLGETDPT